MDAEAAIRSVINYQRESSPNSERTTFKYRSVEEYVTGYESGRFTPLDVARSLVKLVPELNAQTNAICNFNPEKLINAATESTRRWREGTMLRIRFNPKKSR